MRRASLIVCLLGLATGGCLKAPDDGKPQTETATEAPADQVAGSAGPLAAADQTIDWEAARAAKAAGPATDSAVTIQSVTGQGGLPQVPVLLPSGIVQAQDARPPALVATPDGYFATYQTPRYDAIVNGTKKAYSAGVSDGSARPDMAFTLGEASAQLSFSRFGADYLIEFECRQIDAAESCISEDEAKAFADSLFVSQTQ
ncbi:MAG: hypothetical protein KGS00_01355 [Alphaproteobacteria bacterium]|nr:hypothetical protein [Alphaproteobacteria bacterium]